MRRGVHGSDSLEYQIRCYNSVVDKRGAIPPELAMPESVRTASSELKQLCDASLGVSELQVKLFKEIVDVLLQGRTSERAVSSLVISEHVRATDDKNELGLTRASHTRLKTFMARCYPTAEFKSSYRIKKADAPTKSCFTNPFYESPDAASE